MEKATRKTRARPDFVHAREWLIIVMAGALLSLTGGACTGELSDADFDELKKEASSESPPYAAAGKPDADGGKPPDSPNADGFAVDSSTSQGVLGNSLPAEWRPFSPDSPWNKPIPANAQTHPDSDAIMALVASEASSLRFARSYTIPVWVVNSNNVPHRFVRSDKIFDWWDKDRTGWSDVGVPITPKMWAEPTSDGHISIVDPFKGIVWEMSRFAWSGDMPTSTTFNIWKLTGPGFGHPNDAKRWQLRGARGSGFPGIAGLLRPEELENDEIRHALIFSFSKNRRGDDNSQMFINPPASRSDGRYFGRQYPVQGMRFQLDPSLGDADFTEWGLGREAKKVARALQRYGMYLGDNGGAMALMPQLLGPTSKQHIAEWERRYPGLFRDIQKIPTSHFRVVYTGEPTLKKKNKKNKKK